MIRISCTIVLCSGQTSIKYNNSTHRIDSSERMKWCAANDTHQRAYAYTIYAEWKYQLSVAALHLHLNQSMTSTRTAAFSSYRLTVWMNQQVICVIKSYAHTRMFDSTLVARPNPSICNLDNVHSGGRSMFFSSSSSSSLLLTRACVPLAPNYFFLLSLLVSFESFFRTIRLVDGSTARNQLFVALLFFN